MPVFPEGSSSATTIAGQIIRLRKPRNHFNLNHQELQPISPDTDPNAHKSSKANTIISSLFPSNNAPVQNKKKGATFRGLGCTAGAAQQVSVPAVIRSSAGWEGKRVKKKKGHQKRKKESMKLFNENNHTGDGNNGDCDGNYGSCMVMQDVWCGPGIGFSGADAVVGSVDCVVARRNVASGRGKIDGGGGEKINQRERERERERETERERDRERERERDRERERPFLARRAAVNPETLTFLDTDPAFVTSRLEPDVFGTRYYRHIRHPSPDGLAEIMLMHNSFMMGGRLDRFSNWRLDIDHMTYEPLHACISADGLNRTLRTPEFLVIQQLLELGDRIGYVSTGLKEDEISRCVKKISRSIVKEPPSHLPLLLEKKCSICQDEYEEEDELGKLDCGHGFHIHCIKQWLAQKNNCPVCKTAPVSRG